MLKFSVFFVVTLGLLSVAVMTRAFPFNVPTAHTGGFGEPTCQQCHNLYPLRDGEGMLSVTGLPANFEAGKTYALEVELANIAFRGAAFSLSVRFADGQQAGYLLVDPAISEVDIIPLGGIDYAVSGAPFESEENTPALWQLEWRAPNCGSERVLIHLVANAADMDQSPLGDIILTRVFTTSSSQTLECK